MAGKELHGKFDGHASCYIESGNGKADPDRFQLRRRAAARHLYPAGVGPFTLLGQSTINHWGKLGFRYLYWNLMLKGIEVPLPEPVQHDR